jgi:hypothetical protein
VTVPSSVPPRLDNDQETSIPEAARQWRTALSN